MLSLHQLLADLVRLPSVNPMGRTDLPANLLYESRVTDYLEQQFRDLGIAVERQAAAPGRDNLIARYSPPGAARTLLWEAHQDTVPVDGMVIDPFGGTISDGKLHGRGACDVKAGIACMFAAFARLMREKPTNSAAVVLAFTVDEEHTFLGVQHLMKSGVAADWAVVAEPTGLDIVRAHKGVVRWQIETKGIACHSSRPDRGVNAVYAMARVLQGIEHYAAKLQASRTDRLLGAPTLSVGVVRGGVSPNTVPDHCFIELDRRLLPGESPTDAIADLDVYLKNNVGVPFTTGPAKFACSPLSPAGSDALVAALGEVIDGVAGAHDVVAVPYGTDASTIAAAGIPSVVFGPGDIAQAHTKDEWVELRQVEQAAEILFQFACAARA